MTLIEVVFATGILAIGAAGILSGVLQSRKLSEGSIYQNSATSIAHGYLEQIKNMEFASLDMASLPTVINQGQDDPIAVSPLPADPEAGNPDTDVVNVKAIDLNNTPDEAQDDMRLEIVAYVEDVTNPANRLGQCRRVILRYQAFFTAAGYDQRFTNTLYAYRSQVPTF